jgi:hypothetical protein
VPKESVNSAHVSISTPEEEAIELGGMKVFTRDPKLQAELEFGKRWRETRRDIGGLATNEALTANTDD